MPDSAGEKTEACTGGRGGKIIEPSPGPHMHLSQFANLPDVRDGLSRKERVVLYCLHQAQQELGGRNVPTAMLYGRVVEYVDMSEDELQGILQRLISND